MTLRLIHTSDWQIGKVFRFVDNATMGLLQEARLRAITRLGELAGEKGAQHILVAGDVYDMQALSPRSLNQLTRPIFCTNPSERVYITAWGCEIGSGRRNGLQAPGAGGL